MGDLAHSVQMTGDLVGNFTLPVIVDPILKVSFLAVDRLGDDHLNDRPHRDLLTVQQVQHCIDVYVDAKAFDVLEHFAICER